MILGKLVKVAFPLGIKDQHILVIPCLTAEATSHNATPGPSRPRQPSRDLRDDSCNHKKGNHPKGDPSDLSSSSPDDTYCPSQRSKSTTDSSTESSTRDLSEDRSDQCAHRHDRRDSDDRCRERRQPSGRDADDPSDPSDDSDGSDMTRLLSRHRS